MPCTTASAALGSKPPESAGESLLPGQQRRDGRGGPLPAEKRRTPGEPDGPRPAVDDLPCPLATLPHRVVSACHLPAQGEALPRSMAPATPLAAPVVFYTVRGAAPRTSRCRSSDLYVHRKTTGSVWRGLHKAGAAGPRMQGQTTAYSAQQTGATRMRANSGGVERGHKFPLQDATPSGAINYTYLLFGD